MRETLARRAYEQLRLKLARGELAPGARLVNRALADEFGISFTPVREAINQLASEGLVQYVRGGGAFVRDIDRRGLVELYDLREVLEPFAASLAATNAAEDELAELEEICDEWHELARGLRESDGGVANEAQAERWAVNEERFHHVLFEASRNRWLSKVSKDLLLVAQAFGPLRGDPTLLTLGAAAKTWKSHASLLRALRSRDPERASERMREHIQTGRRYVLAFVREKNSTAR